MIVRERHYDTTVMKVSKCEIACLLLVVASVTTFLSQVSIQKVIWYVLCIGSP